jgi:hypothetical protein
MLTPTNIKHLVAIALILGGALGVFSPDSASDEEAIDTITAGIGATIELFTTRIDRKDDV